MQHKLDSLDAVTGDKALAVVEESKRPLRLHGKETPLKSKHPKLVQKLDLR